MPTLTIDNKTYDVEVNKRLVLAVEDAGIPILHRCGGYAKCTTCRVVFNEGEPTVMTEAEKNRLQSEPGLYGKIRLSCQILCDHDMTFNPLMTMYNSAVENAGRRPENEITPDAVWVEKD
jgi:ferredoxin